MGGKSPLSNDSLGNKSKFANAIPDNDNNVVNGFYVSCADSPLSPDMNNDSIPVYNHSDYLSFIGSGDECIGSPVYFFFELGTTQLTDKSQLVNLDELARVTKKYGLSVTVAGAADAATGTTDINNKLSASRTDYIATELCKRGVAVESITKISQGGISNYVPTEANRHTKVQLYIK